MPSATITIKGVAPKKSGQTNGKAWTVYEVDAGEKTFSTLDGAWGLFVGDTLTVAYTVEKNGQYTNYRLGEAPTKPPVAPTVSAPKDQPDKFAILDRKLDEILTHLAAIRKHFAS